MPMIFDKNTVIEQTSSFDELIVSEGVELSAPEGKLLTLTENGREKPLAPGSYVNAVISVTEDFPCPVDDFDTTGYRTALYVRDGKIIPERSARSALIGGQYDDKGMKDVCVRSDGPLFNTLIVENGQYDVENLDIVMNGHGGNDFSGWGSGMLFAGEAKAEVKNLRVRSHGVIRNAVTVADHAEVTFRGADIDCIGGTTAEQIQLREETGNMSGVPWVLGLRGTNRATNIVGSGRASYIDSTIKAEGWGVLSTDGVDMPEKFGDYCVRMNVVNSRVEITGESGYGSYSIGACRNSFDNCKISVPDYALIAANEYAACDFINGTTVDSGRFGLMWHANQHGEAVIENAVFNTGLTTFLVKGCYPELKVKNSVINSGNGVILQLMDNDDPGMFGDDLRIEVDNLVPVKDPEHDVHAENFTDCRMFTFDLKDYSTDLRASFADMELRGDFYNATTNACRVGMILPEGPPPEPPAQEDSDAPKAPPPPLPPSTEKPINLILSFENVKLESTISSSTAKHNVPSITKALNIEMGMVTNTACPAVNNGVIVKLLGNTQWTVTGTSYLTALEIGPDARIVASSMIVDGRPVDIAAGSYKGDIVLKA